MSVNKVNSDGSLSRIAGGSIYSFAPIGAIVPYASSKIPEGYLLCDGREISRTEYAGLFAVIGTAYGTGDGSTTFNIPDLRGKFAEGTPSGESVGTVKSAGLPNITGSVGAIVAETNSSGSGAFSMTQNGAARPSIPANSDNWWRNINFSARNSNSIYGNSTTVQPPAVCINYIIKAKDVAMIGGTQSLADEVAEHEEDIAAIQAVIPYKIDRVRYNLANTDFPSSLVGSDIVTWLNARATDSVFRKPGIHIVELYNTATDNYGYFFIQNLGTQGADTVAGYGVAEFKTYYTAGGRPYYFLLKQSTWSLMHDANNMYLEQSNLTPTATTVTLSPTDDTADNVTLRLRKTGNVVTATYFNSRTDSGALKTNWTSIGTIPMGYRPVETVYTTVNHANSHNVTVGLQFNSNGTIAQYSYTTGNLGYERSVNLTWITG